MDPDPERRRLAFELAYCSIFDDVNVALHTQLGNTEALQYTSRLASNLLQSIMSEPYAHLFEPDQLLEYARNINEMIDALKTGERMSMDPVGMHDFLTVAGLEQGETGRPRIHIDPVWLREALNMRGPTGVAEVLGCHARTVRRRAIEEGILEPCPPVFEYVADENGTIFRRYIGSFTGVISTMTDDELDRIMSEALQIFPNFGRRLLRGYFLSCGHRIPEQRVKDSYHRVSGSTGVFGRRLIRRSKYRVPGPNSLWHNDGQHGLIRWKIVFHMFVDGWSRAITAIHAVNNNRAGTVLQLFLSAHANWGVPRRGRGDRGGENNGVANWMDNVLGLGSYIFGRSVHNTRAERLWVELTQAVGATWKDLFETLEASFGLDQAADAHIWLLHHLFLSVINAHVLEFQAAWNSHVLEIDGGRYRSPRDLWWFGQLERGARGLNVYSPPDDDLQPEDLEGYGIDWEAMGHPATMRHFHQHNPHLAADDENPFRTGDQMPYVDVPEVACPLTLQEVRYLDDHLHHFPNTIHSTKEERIQLWVTALRLAGDIFANR